MIFFGETGRVSIGVILYLHGFLVVAGEVGFFEELVNELTKFEVVLVFATEGDNFEKLARKLGVIFRSVVC